MSADVSVMKPYKGLGMEGAVAKWYASLTSKAMDDFQALARRMADRIPSDCIVLEVAPGPGYFSVELSKLGNYQISGLDISETFVAIARANAAKANVEIDFQHGNAAMMPFPPETFDFLLCRAAFKNFAEPVRALQEMHRVLKPDGQALIIDLRRDASLSSIREAVNGMGLGVVNRFITRLAFRFMLLRRAYKKSELQRFIAETGFHDADIRETLTGFEVWLLKRNQIVANHTLTP